MGTPRRSPQHDRDDHGPGHRHGQARRQAPSRASARCGRRRSSSASRRTITPRRRWSPTGRPASRRSGPRARRSTRRSPASRPARSRCSTCRPSRARRSRCRRAIMVIYADRESFTFMTPEGHALPAWITFSAYRDADETVAQAQALERTSDPLIELTLHVRREPRQRPVLGADAREPRPVAGRRRTRSSRSSKVCVDKRRQWKYARQRAPQRGGQHGRGHRDRPRTLGPARRLEAPARPVTPSTRSSSAAAPTGSPPRSSSPAPGAPSGSTRPRTPSAAGPLRGADAARVRPRPVLVGPPAEPRVAVLPVAGPRPARARVGPPGRPGRPRARARPQRRAGAGPRRAGPRRGAGARRRRLGRACSGRWSATWERLVPMLLAPGRRGCRATRSLWPASALPALLPADGPGPARVPRAGGAGAVRGPRAHSMLPLGRPLTRVVRARARAPRACGRLAAREGGSGAIAAALEAEARGPGGRDRDRPPGRRARRPAAGPRRTCSTSRRARCSRSPATACRPVPATASRASATGRACSRSTGRSTGRSRGRTRRRRARDRPPRRARCARSRVGRRLSRGPRRRSTVRPARPAHARRPVARPGGQARRVGVLPRPQRLGRAT